MSVGYGGDRGKEKVGHPRMRKREGERYVLRGVVGGRKGEDKREEGGEEEWKGYVDEEGGRREVGPFGGYED